MTAKTIRIFTPYLPPLFLAVLAMTIDHFLVLFAVDDAVDDAVDGAVAVAVLVIFVVVVVTIVAVVFVLMNVVGSGRAACI